MSSPREIVIPKAEEDAAINTGIAADPDTFALTPAASRQFKPIRGRPRGSGPKAQLTVRFVTDPSAASTRADAG